MFMETLALDLPGRFDSRLHGSRRFSKAFIAQLLVIDPGYFDMDIDAV
jgi:hypothetical protein